MRIFNSNKGFTLVEILVVITVLAVTGTFIFNIFASILRGNNKTQIIASIKQNGQAALEIMDKTIRGADNVVCISEDKKNIVLVKNGIYTRYRFVFLSGTNGSIQQDNPDKLSVGVDPATDKEYTDPSFVNKVCANADPQNQPIILTDTNTQTGVSVENGSFDKAPAAGFKDQVTIKFLAKPGVAAPSVVSGQIDPVSFQTTVSLR